MKLRTIAYVTLLGATASTAAEGQALEWLQQTGTKKNDTIYSSAPDGAGGLYVGGATTGDLSGANAGSADAWCARHDAQGNRTWVRQLGSSAHDAAAAVASDGASGVYVAGFTLGDLGGANAGHPDGWIAHYDGSGNQSWVRQLGTAAYDTIEDALPDGAGGVFVTGITYGSLGGPHAGDADAWLAHYDRAGQQTWIVQWGTIRPNIATSLATDGAGGLFVGGYGVRLISGPGGDLDAWVTRYDANGNRIWIQHFGASTEDFLRSAAPDGAGGVYLTGHSGFTLFEDHDAWLARYDGAGNQLWREFVQTINGDFAIAVAPDDAGGVFVGGSTYGSLGGPHQGDEDAWLASFDQGGNPFWIQQFATAGLDSLKTASSDGMGGVFVAGSTVGDLGGPSLGSGDAWLARISDVEASRYCTPAMPNSTGQPSILSVSGSSRIAANSLMLVASQLRAFSFGVFLASTDQGLVMSPAGSQGTLCLGGAIGRYVGPGQVQLSGAAGTMGLSLDLTAMPTPTGQVAVQPGDTWNFQAWYRDINPGPTSNFTDGVSVAFR